MDQVGAARLRACEALSLQAASAYTETTSTPDRSPETDLANVDFAVCMSFTYRTMSDHLVIIALAAAAQQLLAHLTCAVTCVCKFSNDWNIVL